MQEALADTDAQLDVGAERLRACLALTTAPNEMHETAPDNGRRDLNSACYEELYLDEHPDTSAATATRNVLRQPFQELQDAAHAYPSGHATAATRRAIKHERCLDHSVEASENQGSEELAGLFAVNVSSTSLLVELRGFEPLTPSMRTGIARQSGPLAPCAIG